MSTRCEMCSRLIGPFLIPLCTGCAQEFLDGFADIPPRTPEEQVAFDRQRKSLSTAEAEHGG